MKRLLLLPTVVVVEAVVLSAEVAMRLMGVWDRYQLRRSE